MSEPTARLKDHLAAELTAVRARSNALTVELLDEAELRTQHSPLMSPLVWDLAHVGNYEEQWLLRNAAGQEALRPDIDHIYDAFENARADRIELPLLTPAEAQAYNAAVRTRVLDSLDQVRLDRPLLHDGLVYHMVVQHEHQHDETMLATLQLREGPAVLPEQPTTQSRNTRPPALPTEVLVPAGPFTMGTTGDPTAYDNERPAHTVQVPAFWLETTPVTNGAYQEFLNDGGYDNERWWSTAGWQWNRRAGIRAPAFWHSDGHSWWRRRFGRTEPVPAEEPVQHVSWYEAQAYAAWAGKRLPTEVEWEKAARHDPDTNTSRYHPWGETPPQEHHANLGQRYLGPRPAAGTAGASPCGAVQLLGDVWEWTATDFAGYPGFVAYPYREYSEVFFGPDYKVLRGGSWATHSSVARASFRNWDYPIRRQIFAGFRCARDVEVR